MNIKFKKIISVFLTVALLLSMFLSLNGLADSSQTYLSLKSDVTSVAKGDEVTVTLVMKYKDAIGLNYGILYDSNVLTYVADSYTPNYDLSWFTDQSYFTPTVGGIYGNALGVKNDATILLDDEVSLFTLKFIAKEDTTVNSTTLTLNYYDSYANVGLTSPDFDSLNNLTVGITEPVSNPTSLSLKSDVTSVAKGKELTVTLAMKYKDAIGLNYGILYDSNVLTYVADSYTPNYDLSWFEDQSNFNPTIGGIFGNALGVKNDATMLLDDEVSLFTLKFKVKENTTVSSTTLTLNYDDSYANVGLTSPDFDFLNDLTVDIKNGSNDASLKSLTANGNAVSLIANQTDYVCDVPYGTTSITVSAVPTDSNATVTLTKATAEVNSPAKIKVTAEDGTVKNYTVSINVLQNPDTIKALSIISNTDEAIKGEEITVTLKMQCKDAIGLNYGLTYDSDVLEYIEDSYTPNNEISWFSEQTNFNSNILGEIYGNALGVKSDTTVLTANEVSLFTIKFRVKDDTTKTSTKIGLSSYDSYACVGFDCPDFANLNELTLAVKDKEPEKSNDATLKSLTANGSAVTLIANQTDYVCDVPFGTNSISVSGVANDINATATLTKATAEVNSPAKITVTAEDGTVIIYTVSINVLPNDKAEVSEISVDGNNATTNDNINYNSSVIKNNGVILPTISENAKISEQSVVSGSATLGLSGNSISYSNLAVGTTMIKFKVTAQDNMHSNEYYLSIYRKNNEAKASNITLNGTAVTIDSDNEYRSTVFTPKKSGTILLTLSKNATITSVNASNGTATMVSNEEITYSNLPVGDTTITFVVTAEDGVTTNEYNVVVSYRLYGDVDGNGRIQTTDALIIMAYSVHNATATEIINANPVVKKVADIDGNGRIQTTDALIIMAYSVHNATATEIINAKNGN